MKYCLYNHIIDNIVLMGSYILLVPTQAVIHIIILQIKLQLVVIVINEINVRSGSIHVDR